MEPKRPCKTWPFIASVTGCEYLAAGPARRPAPEPLFCDNDTNAPKTLGSAVPTTPKDGISDRVVYGTAT